MMLRWESLIAYLIMVLCAVCAYGSSDYYVDPVNGDDGNDGSAGLPWRTITHALESVGGDEAHPVTIYALAGTYAASTNGETFPLRMEGWVSLIGEDQDTTILDAEEGAYHVIYCHGVDNLTIAQLTITAGYADGSSGAEGIGAGIYCYNSSPTIENNTISSNLALYGGGIYLCASSPTILNNAITDNSAERSAGGIRCGDNSSPTMLNNTISYNTVADGSGGGIDCWESSPTIENNTISDNSAWYGGGIACWADAAITVENNTITGNSAWYGGGIACWANSAAAIYNNVINGNPADYGGGVFCTHCSPTIYNNTISGNSADYGGAIYSSGESSPTVVDSILWGDCSDEVYVDLSSSITITYSDIEGGWEGEGNIEEDPLFVEGYYLSQTAAGQGGQSPCVDAGDDDASEYGLDTYTTRTDQVPDSGTVDMGYHYPIEGGTHDPELSNPTYSPQSGRSDTNFTFTIHYYHAGGLPPSRIEVFVNDAPHDMTLDSGTAADGTYAWTGLIPEGGRAQYHFEAEDSYGASARIKL